MSWEALNLAATDRSSGSAVVASRAADAFIEIAATLSRDAVMDAARVLVQGQPVMASCIRLADAVLRGLERDGLVGAKQAARAFGERLASERASLGDHLRRKLPRGGTVLTVSASSTVLEALYGSDVRVLCATSEPGGEGRGAVDALQERGVEAVLIPDGAVANQSARADAIAFGADVLGPTAILNKTGTLAAALGARTNARPTFCLAGTTKLLDETTWQKVSAAAEHLKVEGVPVFEEIPADLVTTFVTEEGPTSHRALRRSSRATRLHQQIDAWLS